jgi:hypothetical protein
MRDQENEKNKLINQKSIKLSSYADKERVLDDKEYHNEEIRK